MRHPRWGWRRNYPLSELPPNSQSLRCSSYPSVVLSWNSRFSGPSQNRLTQPVLQGVVPSMCESIVIPSRRFTTGYESAREVTQSDVEPPVQILT